MTEPTPTPALPTPEFELKHEYEGVRYRWCLTREAIDETLHHCHIIPLGRGWTSEFFRKNYPGGSLDHFIHTYRAADILLRNGGSAWAGRCHWKVKHFYFTDKTSFAVEWDETAAEDDNRFFWTGRRDQEETGSGSVLVKLTSDDYETPGRIREISESIAHELGAAGSADANDGADAETRAMDALKRRHARRRRP